MIKPKKYLGQHFLRDDNIARKIVAQLTFPAGDILEIGPGTGVLTKHLIKRDDIGDLNLLEIDREAVLHLEREFPMLAGRIIHDDFLKCDPTGIFPGNFSVIGNFPYNISSQILFRILGMNSKIDEVVGMFQKEVADRIVSSPSSKTYGILSVLVRAYYDTAKLFEVPPGVFFPVPKVKSAVIKLTRNYRDLKGTNEKVLFALVRAAFNQRRKTLRNSLSRFSFSDAEKSSVLFSKRAEELSIDDYIALTNSLEISQESM